MCAWSAHVMVVAGWLSGSGYRWLMYTWSSWVGGARPNTVLAAAYDLKVFFTVVARPPDQVRPADVLAFITAQRTGAAGSCAAAGGAGGRARRRVGRDRTVH